MIASNTADLKSGVRSIFVSDLHLGSRFAQVDRMLQLLESHQPEYLYLVGDIVDGWILKRKWHWPENYNRLVDRVVELSNAGTIIRLTPGNHDEFLRRFLMNSEFVSIDNEFIHIGADGRKSVITHGDLYDDFETDSRFLSMAGGFGYEVVLRLDHWVNRLIRRFGFRRRRISQTIKQNVKLAVKFVSDFEKRIAERAVEVQCDAVVCGHIHVPSVNQVGEVLYINLGDWIENGTALFEYGDGRLELIDMDGNVVADAPALSSEIPRSKGLPTYHAERVADVA